jgi:uncharacterized phiE125 gp8 family phage protein
MSLQRLSGPADEPISLAQAKLYLRVDGDAEDAAIGLLISAARALFERETGLVLLEQVWEWTLDHLPAPGVDGRRTLEVPLGPVSAISDFVVRDGDGGEVDIPSTDYVLDLASQLPRLVEAKRALWPAPKAAAAGIRLVFTAGFGADAENVPADIRQALLALIAETYDKRGLGEGELDLASPRVAALVAPYRRARL